MKGYVILVDFLLKPGSKAEFRRAIDANARASCRNERGCSPLRRGRAQGR